MPCGHANRPAPNAPSHSPFSATCRIGCTSPFGKQSFAPQRSAIHSVPFGATSIMLIEPSVRSAGAFIQPVTVRYGFGGESLAHAASSAAAASAARAASREVDMTPQSARRARAVQHCFAQSGNAFKVAFMLRALGVPYESVFVD